MEVASGLMASSHKWTIVCRSYKMKPCSIESHYDSLAIKPMCSTIKSLAPIVTVEMWSESIQLMVFKYYLRALRVSDRT